MNVDDVEQRGFLKPLERLRYRWLSCARIMEVGADMCYQQWCEGGWQSVAPGLLSKSSPFSQVAVLLADEKCSFRCFELPVDMVAAKDLDEAIALDVALWSPFGADISLLSFSERIDNHWKVGVWIWPKQEEQRLLQRLADGVRCTHIMPAMAWYVATVRASSDVLLINVLETEKQAEKQAVYALVSPAGVPKTLSHITSELESRRFWRSLGDRRHAIEHAFLCEGDEFSWLSDTVSVIKMRPVLPRLKLLSRASLAGVEDWLDPSYWRRPMLAILSLICVWALADAAVLEHRTEKVQAMLSHAKGEALDVLKYRDRVDSMQLRLQKYADMRVAQHKSEWLLGALSQSIPTDIWLNSLQSGQGWADIHGQGKNVVRLIVLLEKIDGIKKVMMLSDIHPDVRTGLESFQLRLILQRGQSKVRLDG